jgi:hypothetical protein
VATIDINNTVGRSVSQRFRQSPIFWRKFLLRNYIIGLDLLRAKIFLCRPVISLINEFDKIIKLISMIRHTIPK